MATLEFTGSGVMVMPSTSSWMSWEIASSFSFFRRSSMTSSISSFATSSNIVELSCSTMRGRNEELILIYAEAQIGRDVNEVLKQRRYSLLGEGHRWCDLRRKGRLGEVNVDRVGDIVHTEFPRPDAPTLTPRPGISRGP